MNFTAGHAGSVIFALNKLDISLGVFLGSATQISMFVLKGFEIIRAAYLDPVPFDMDRDLITPTFKKKRPQMLKYYQQAERDAALLEQSRIVLALRLGNTKARTMKSLTKLELLWELYVMLLTLLQLILFMVQQHIHPGRIARGTRL
ncbi:uncharacterized protein LOC141723867 isoform X5 [Apium graveolens]|uniref:uncharacterized protein LOC141723867 isoform X5 n=1 Tax=Apium graveolens TaxID=4045 RepID=UPI003D7ABB8F